MMALRVLWRKWTVMARRWRDPQTALCRLMRGGMDGRPPEPALRNAPPEEPPTVA
jgi:hypothetical protein